MLRYNKYKKIVVNEGALWTEGKVAGSVSAFRIGNNIYFGKLSNHPDRTTHHVDIMRKLQKMFKWTDDDVDAILDYQDINKLNVEFGYYNPKQHKFVPLLSDEYATTLQNTKKPLWFKLPRLSNNVKAIELDI